MTSKKILMMIAFSSHKIKCSVTLKKMDFDGEKLWLLFRITGDNNKMRVDDVKEDENVQCHSKALVCIARDEHQFHLLLT